MGKRIRRGKYFIEFDRRGKIKRKFSAKHSLEVDRAINAKTRVKGFVYGSRGDYRVCSRCNHSQKKRVGHMTKCTKCKGNWL